MGFLFASLIVVLTAASYGLEALGLPVFPGLAPARLLVLVGAGVWAFVEALLQLKKSASMREEIQQCQLVKDAARKEAQTFREELVRAKQDLESLKKAPRGEDALQILSLLQQKGRFLDFVMDDVTKYPDAQIGAAARVVHQGCAHVIREYFDLKPVETIAEGGVVTLDKDYDHQRYRLIGRMAGEAPYRGRLLHRGWLTTDIRLPERTGAAPSGLDVLAPAEVEVS